MDPWNVLRALWLFLPAYVGNMSPVTSAKLVPRWKAPIDGGRLHRDGKRVLGDGKTWRGLAGGALAGGLTALAMAAIAPAAGSSDWLAGWDLGQGGYHGGELGAGEPACVEAGTCASSYVGSTPWWAVFAFGAIVGLLALIGDATESYFKRRRGLERGAPWIPFDQLDFVVFGLIGMVIAAPLLPTGWVWEALFGDWVVLATLLIGTVFLHLFVNRVGYWLGLKEVPW